MKTNNIVMSSRGQITLPSEIRKKYGMDEGSVLVAEDRNGEIILKPAAVYAVDYYTDEQIKDWMTEDGYKNDKEREETRAKLKKLAKAR